jgi:glycine cleavage system H protein
MGTQCPFLKDEKVVFCKAFPMRKMLPYDRLYLKEHICVTEEHSKCPIHCNKETDSITDHPSHKKVCPFMEVEDVLFCGVYPVKKMIPASAFKLECPCTSAAYSGCPAYRQIAHGDDAYRDVATVRGFLVDDKFRYHRGHLWLQRINRDVRLGLDDFCQWLLGDIKNISFPSHGELVRRGKTLLRISCSHGMTEIVSPLSATIMEINEHVCHDYSLINTDPYGAGWLLKMRVSQDEGDRLERREEGFLPPSATRGWLKDEIDRLHHVLKTEIGVTMSDGGEITKNLLDAVTKKQWQILIKVFLKRKEG